MTLFLPLVRVSFLNCRCKPISNCSFLRNSRSLAWLYAPSRHLGSKNDNEKSLSKVKSRSEVGAATTLEHVKETTKTASYWGIILAGFGLTGVLFYAVFNELFSSKSPSSVYGAALQRCCHEPRILDALGEPLKGFGEETRRGRRRHVSHLFYERDGINYLRMKFYIQGSRRKGTVHLEMREIIIGIPYTAVAHHGTKPSSVQTPTQQKTVLELDELWAYTHMKIGFTVHEDEMNEKKKFEYRYLFVQLEEYPRDIIILEDNRYDHPSPAEGNKIFDTLL